MPLEQDLPLHRLSVSRVIFSFWVLVNLVWSGILPWQCSSELIPGSVLENYSWQGSGGWELNPRRSCARQYCCTLSPAPSQAFFRTWPFYDLVHILCHFSQSYWSPAKVRFPLPYLCSFHLWSFQNTLGFHRRPYDPQLRNTGNSEAGSFTLSSCHLP